MTAFLAGLGLGLTLIMPIGAQNVFVLNHGLQHRLPRSLWAAGAAATADTLLIVLGAAGASALVTEVPALRSTMVLVGVVFLLVLSWHSLRGDADAVDDGRSAPLRPRRTVAQGFGVSLLNPHAILDTVGVIGGAIAAQPVAARSPFAGGTIAASWLWFTVLVLAASVLHSHLTRRVRTGIQRATGLFMLGLAALLGLTLV
ncbi:MAG: LysE/ArgO family amino acid transporter [Acidimicrobiales bacterium]